jgi:hypothetical protein
MKVRLRTGLAKNVPCRKIAVHTQEHELQLHLGSKPWLRQILHLHQC